MVALHQRSDHIQVGGVATNQAVRADGPDIAGARHRHDGCFRHIVCGIRFLSVRLCVGIGVGHATGEQCLDLSILETGQSEVVSRLGQIGQLQGQHLLVPARIQCQPVVGDHQCPLLRDGQMGQFDHRHLIEPELARGG